jgi:hypothetical protein
MTLGRHNFRELHISIARPGDVDIVPTKKYDPEHSSTMIKGMRMIIAIEKLVDGGFKITWFKLFDLGVWMTQKTAVFSVKYDRLAIFTTFKDDAPQECKDVPESGKMYHDRPKQ